MTNALLNNEFHKKLQFLVDRINEYALGIEQCALALETLSDHNLSKLKGVTNNLYFYQELTEEAFASTTTKNETTPVDGLQMITDMLHYLRGLQTSYFPDQHFDIQYMNIEPAYQAVQAMVAHAPRKHDPIVTQDDVSQYRKQQERQQRYRNRPSWRTDRGFFGPRH